MSIAFVQQVIGAQGASGANVAYTVPSGHGTTAGNLLVLGTSSQNSTRTLTSVSDTHTNPWQVDGAATALTSAMASVALATADAVSDIITCHFNASATTPVAGVYEFSGLAASSWLAAVSAVKNISGSPTLTTNAVTCPPGGLVVALWSVNAISGTTITPGAGYTALPITTNSVEYVFGVYQVDSGAGGSYAPSATLSNNAIAGHGFAAAYNPASSSPSKGFFF